jgi:hypothetical protein
MSQWRFFDGRSVALARVLLGVLTFSLFSELSTYVRWSDIEVIPRSLNDLISQIVQGTLEPLCAWLELDTLQLLLSLEGAYDQCVKFLTFTSGLPVPVGIALVMFTLGYWTRISLALCLLFSVQLWRSHGWLLIGEDQALLWWWWIGLGIPWSTRGSIDVIINSLRERPEEGDTELNCLPPIHDRPLMSLSALGVIALTLSTAGDLLAVDLSHLLSSSEGNSSVGVKYTVLTNALFFGLYAIQHWTVRSALSLSLVLLSLNHLDDPSALLSMGVGGALMIPSELWLMLSQWGQKRSGGKLYLFYDGECGVSHECARIFSRLDLYHRVLWLGHTEVPFSPISLSLTELQRSKKTGMLAYEPETHQLFFGVDALPRLARTLPFLGWPLSKGLTSLRFIFAPIYSQYVSIRMRLPGRPSLSVAYALGGEGAEEGGGLRTQLVKILPLNHSSGRATGEAEFGFIERGWHWMGSAVVMITFALLILPPSPQDRLSSVAQPRGVPIISAQALIGTAPAVKRFSGLSLEDPTRLSRSRPYQTRTGVEFIFSVNSLKKTLPTRWTSSEPPPPFDLAPALFRRVVRRATALRQGGWRQATAITFGLRAKGISVQSPDGQVYYRWKNP